LFPRIDGATFDVRPVRLVHGRGFPRSRLESYGSTQHPESRRARMAYRLVSFAFGCAVATVVSFAHGAVTTSAPNSDCLPGRHPTCACDAAKNRQSGSGRLATSGAVVAVRARLVADVRTAQAPAPGVTL